MCLAAVIRGANQGRLARVMRRKPENRISRPVNVVMRVPLWTDLLQPEFPGSIGLHPEHWVPVGLGCEFL